MLLGAAGAGKTTTLRVIAGLDRPDSGRVFAARRGCRRPRAQGSRHRDDLRQSGALSRQDRLREHRPSAADTRHGARRDRGAGRAGRRLRCGSATSFKRLPKTMSGGERQRVALSDGALVRRPTLFLLGRTALKPRRQRCASSCGRSSSGFSASSATASCSPRRISPRRWRLPTPS